MKRECDFYTVRFEPAYELEVEPNEFSQALMDFFDSLAESDDLEGEKSYD